ncbi:MAG: DUF302 domain-containing protein [Spirochaetia bacterium]
MKKNILFFILFLQAQMGFSQIIKENSHLNFSQTVAALEKEISARGLTIFAKIDHAKAAQKVKLEMTSAMVIVFGNPAVGTLLMHDNLDWVYELPLKIAVYQDKNGKIWLSTRLLAKDISTPTQQDKVKSINNLLKTLLTLKM